MDWSVLIRYWSLIWDGLLTTLQLSAVIIPAAIGLGLLIGSLRAMGPDWIRRSCGIYVEVLRNIPPVLHLFIFFFTLKLGQWQAAIAALALYQSAEMSETFRSGILSIPRTQIESAQSSGFSTFQIVLYVLLPQAFLVVLPPLATNILSAVKNTSLAMILGIRDLTFNVQEINYRTFRGFEAATATTILYLLLSLLIANSMQFLEKMLSVRERVIHR